MRYLIVLEPVETGFAVQVPDLAISTYGETLDSAKEAARDAISVNIEAYREAGQNLPDPMPLEYHFNNPEFGGLLFAYVDVLKAWEKMAA